MKQDFIKSWKEELPSKKEELLLYLLDLKKLSFEETDKMARRAHELVFSEIDCLDCANCCKTTPPIIKEDEIRRMASYIKISPKQFRRMYILEDFNGELSFRKVPCEFLQKDNKCSIYEVRPASCRGYPHTDLEGFARRTYLHRANLEVCPAVKLILEKMKQNIQG